MEICDYSTYYQPVVMGDMFGFGRPMDYDAFLWQPGILTMAWGSVVRQIAAGLDIVLDEPLTESVERRAATRDTDSVSGDVKEGTMGAVRFELIGKVDGISRVVVEHVTRTDAESDQDWENPPAGHDGCYRIKITGEPMMKVDFTHHGEHGDHNVSGMITTAQRIINALPAVVAAEAGSRHGHRPAAGHGPWAGCRRRAPRHEHPRPLHRPGQRRHRHRRRPGHRRRVGSRTGRSRRRRPHLQPHREPAPGGQGEDRGRRPALRRRPRQPRRPRRHRRAGADGVRRARPARHHREQRRRQHAVGVPRHGREDAQGRVRVERVHRPRAEHRRRAADARRATSAPASSSRSSTSPP